MATTTGFQTPVPASRTIAVRPTSGLGNTGERIPDARVTRNHLFAVDFSPVIRQAAFIVSADLISATGNVSASLPGLDGKQVKLWVRALASGGPISLLVEVKTVTQNDNEETTTRAVIEFTGVT